MQLFHKITILYTLVQAIMRPLALKTSKLRVLLTIFMIWGVSSLISLPPIIYSQEFQISR